MALGFSLIGGALLAAVIMLVMLWPSSYYARRGTGVQVLVLGDVGRSPRMQYHALSIAQKAPVQLIGYFESDLLEELARHPRLRRVPLTPPPAFFTKKLPFVLGGPLKAAWQLLDLALALAYRTTPSRWLLVQNPPAIPTMAVAALMARLRKTRLVIDWHNYGWTILAGTRGVSHPLVALAQAYEIACSRFGSANLTVTKAMAAQLRAPPYQIPPTTPLLVLHDRPAALFQPLSLPLPAPTERVKAVVDILGSEGENIFKGTPAGVRVLVSSTSWTPDEDFQLLLDALVEYVRSTPAPHQRPPLLVVVTGKGPQRALYEAKVSKLAAEGLLPAAEVAVRTAFLPMADYASLLALADLGVCLHCSSSGVDLPMKVVDMFGAGLPVAAYAAYESFGELVRDGHNGRGFNTAPELAALLAQLLDPSRPEELAQLRAGAREESRLRWSEEWDRVAAPLLLSDVIGK